MSSEIETQKPIIVGLDFGGVLSILDHKRIDSTADHNNTTLDMPGALEKLRMLIDPKVASHNYHFYIISYCGQARATETYESLRPYFELFHGIFFVKTRDHKADLCKYLGCHIMVDDRPEILANIRKKNPSITTICFGEKKRYPHLHATNWDDVFNMLESYKYKPIFPDDTINIVPITHHVE